MRGWEFKIEKIALVSLSMEFLIYGKGDVQDSHKIPWSEEGQNACAWYHEICYSASKVWD